MGHAQPARRCQVRNVVFIWYLESGILPSRLHSSPLTPNSSRPPIRVYSPSIRLADRLMLDRLNHGAVAQMDRAGAS